MMPLPPPTPETDSAWPLADLLSRLPPGLRRYLPYLLVGLVFLALLVFGDKFWDANDDEHMAMLAQGYGLAGTPSPLLVYSNVVWGWLVVALGAPFGIPGYTLGAYLVMFASAAAIAWVMLQRGMPGLLAAIVLLAMFIRPLLEPQFSITAGYAAVAGMALLVSCEHAPRWSTAACGGLFLLLAGLLRFQELLFVGLVSAPFLLAVLYRNRRTTVSLRIAAALLLSLALLGGCRLLDAQQRAGAEWQRFDQMHPMRRQFTDYGLSGYFLAHSRQLRDVGLSHNDMRLVGNWFFLDESVYNDRTLGRLLGELPAGERIAYNLQSYRDLPQPFTAPLVALLSALLLFALLASGRRRVALAALALFGLAMLIFLCMGRPGIPRIFPGAVGALALLTLLDVRPGKRWVLLVAAALLCVVCLDGIGFLAGHHTQAARAGAVKRALCQLPDREQLQIVWGAPRGFPDRYVYSPTQAPDADCLPHIYQIGVLELLPANLQNLHAHTQGKDLIPALLAGQHFDFLSTAGHLAMLDQFLQEHYGVRLHSEPSYDQAGITQFRVWVEGAPRPSS